MKLKRGTVTRRHGLAYERWVLNLVPYRAGRHSRCNGTPFETRKQAQSILDQIHEKIEQGMMPERAIAEFFPPNGLPIPVIAMGAQAEWKEEYRKRMFEGAARRATANGISFYIGIEDIPIPDRCPVLGIILRPTEPGTGRNNHAPSIERIDSRIGYVRGNVLVVSWRANKIKGDATAEELRKVADWAEYLDHCPPMCAEAEEMRKREEEAQP